MHTPVFALTYIHTYMCASYPVHRELWLRLILEANEVEADLQKSLDWAETAMKRATELAREGDVDGTMRSEIKFPFQMRYPVILFDISNSCASYRCKFIVLVMFFFGVGAYGAGSVS